MSLGLAHDLQSRHWLQRSLVLAEWARLAYEPPHRVEPVVRSLGGRLVFWNRDGAEAYGVDLPHDRILVFRGTEPDSWNDWRADLDFRRVALAPGGRGHAGFLEELRDLWNPLVKWLAPATPTAPPARPLWVTGHSLGGALAQLFAFHLEHAVGPDGKPLDEVLSAPRSTKRPRAAFATVGGRLPAEEPLRRTTLGGVVTFGSPRTLDRTAARKCRFPALRWIQNNDVVPRLPPAWLGFRHVGREVFVDQAGQLRQFRGWERWLDCLFGWFRAVRAGRFDAVEDHAIDGYRHAIFHAVRRYAPIDSALRFPQSILIKPRRRQPGAIPSRRSATSRAA